MTRLVKIDEAGACWYPVSISRLDTLLSRCVVSLPGFPHAYALKRNIAYNLQYIEFLDRCLHDLKRSSVIETQIYKNIILTGCGIIESLLHYLLIRAGKHSTEQWAAKTKFFSNEKRVGTQQLRAETIISSKLPTPKLKEMPFDTLIKKARSHHIFGPSRAMYQKLDALRNLRNKVHLQLINSPTDTDWNSFGRTHVSDMSKVLHAVFTSSIFTPTADERKYFEYLKTYFR